MKIGELSKQTGVPTSTIRFYEQKGLLPPPERKASGYRNYAQDAKDKLQLIKFSQSLGFTLDELPGLMQGHEGMDKDLIMQRLQQKYAEVESLLQQLNNKKARLDMLIHRLNTRWNAGECMGQSELAEILEQAN